MAEIMQVPGEMVADVWDEVAPHLDAAVRMTHGCFELEDVAQLCVAGGATLFVVGEADKIIGALVGEIVQFPRRRAARVWLAGGKDIGRWVGEMEAAFETWARAWGCDALTASGRKGWARLTGAEQSGVELWRDLEPAGVH